MACVTSTAIVKIDNNIAIRLTVGQPISQNRSSDEKSRDSMHRSSRMVWSLGSRIDSRSRGGELVVQRLYSAEERTRARSRERDGADGASFLQPLPPRRVLPLASISPDLRRQCCQSSLHAARACRDRACFRAHPKVVANSKRRSTLVGQSARVLACER